MIDVPTSQAKCENPTLVLNIFTAKGNFPLQYCSLLEACSWLVLRSNSRGKFVSFTRCRCDFCYNAAIWNWTLPTWSHLPMIHFYHEMPKNKQLFCFIQRNQSHWFLMYLTKWTMICFRGSCHGFQAKSCATFILTAISIWLSSPALLFCKRAESLCLSTWNGFILRAAPVFFPNHSELSENKVWLLCCSPALYMNCIAANRSTSHVL